MAVALADEDAQAAAQALGCTVTVEMTPADYKAQIDAAYEVIAKIHPNLRFYWTDQTQLAQALAEGIRGHVADLRRRVPGASLVVQVDEVLQRVNVAQGDRPGRVEPLPVI